MPVHYRKFLLKETEKTKKKEAEQIKKQKGKQTPSSKAGVPSAARNALQGQGNRGGMGR